MTEEAHSRLGSTNVKWCDEHDRVEVADSDHTPSEGFVPSKILVGPPIVGSAPGPGSGPEIHRLSYHGFSITFDAKQRETMLGFLGARTNAPTYSQACEWARGSGPCRDVTRIQFFVVDEVRAPAMPKSRSTWVCEHHLVPLLVYWMFSDAGLYGETRIYSVLQQ